MCIPLENSAYFVEGGGVDLNPGPKYLLLKE